MDFPGGYTAATYPGDSTVQATAANAGDVYFYDWDTRVSESRPIDHVSINVGYGSTLDGLYGDYVDAHTSNRHKAFWTLQKYNMGLARYTKIWAVRVSTSN